MSFIENFDGEGRMWVNGHPMHGAIFLIIIHCVVMVLCTFLTASGYGGALGALSFSRDDVLSGHIWQLFTYVFVAMPSLNFAIMMLVLYWLGTGLETSIGRRSFFTFYGTLILSHSVFFTLAGYFGEASGLSGPGYAIFGIFIAYATVYPDVGIFFGIPAKYIAYALIGISVLSCLASHDWVSLTFVGFNSGLAYGAMRILGFQGGFDWWDRWFARAESPPKPRSRREEINDSINAILEKIATHGINSLTDSERGSLERARTALRGKGDEGSRSRT